MSFKKKKLNYRPIISITPTKKAVPVKREDLEKLDKVIRQKVKVTKQEEVLTHEQVSNDFNVVTQGNCNQEGFGLHLKNKRKL